MIQTFPINTNFPTYMQAQGYHYGFPQVSQGLQQPSLSDVLKPIIPTSNDVLMGRGGNNNKWHGNQRLRDMAQAQVEQYKKADKKEKNKTSLLLVSQVKALSPPGRFLKRDPTTLSWHVVPDELAREKASQCLRDAVSGAKKNTSETTKTANKDDNNKPKSVGPTAVSSACTMTGKRKAAVTSTAANMMINHYDSQARKRQRVQAPSKSFGPSDPEVIVHLLENTPANRFFNEDFSLFSVLEACLDLNEWSDETNKSLDENLTWEPIPLSEIQ